MVATRKRSGFLAILALATAGSAVGFGPVALEPQHGPVGTLVTIGGDSFDPQGDYTVTLHGTALTVASITETAIEVTIPTGATSGFFVVGDGTQSIRSERAFILTRPMAVVYESELPPDFSDYDL
ncbi:MAG: IPT/TIG domain-containing protein, partial [Opitutaceae bacterium]